MTLAIVTQPATLDAPPDTLRGRAMLEGSLLQYANAIEPGDLVLMNFNTKQAAALGGLYALELLEGGAVAWQGCRRIVNTSAGVRIDQDGRGDWLTAPSLEALGARIVGAVEQVLRPTLLAPPH